MTSQVNQWGKIRYLRCDSNIISIESVKNSRDIGSKKGIQGAKSAEIRRNRRCDKKNSKVIMSENKNHRDRENVYSDSWILIWLIGEIGERWPERATRQEKRNETRCERRDDRRVLQKMGKKWTCIGVSTTDFLFFDLFINFFTPFRSTLLYESLLSSMYI